MFCSRLDACAVCHFRPRARFAQDYVTSLLEAEGRGERSSVFNDQKPGGSGGGSSSASLDALAAQLSVTLQRHYPRYLGAQIVRSDKVRFSL
jgi:hypothetical protein